MITSSERFLAALGLSHRISAQAILLDADGNIDLPIQTGAVTLDATAATRGALSLELALDNADLSTLIPDSPDSPLAPYGNEIAVTRGLTMTDGTTEARALGIFRIDEVDVTDNGDEVTVSISGLDRSAAVIEAVFEDAGSIDAATNVSDAIQSLLDPFFDFTYDFVETAEDVDLPALAYEAGDDRWDFCRACAEAAQCTLYFNNVGTLVLAQLPQSLTAVYEITEGEGGTLLGASKNWSREDAVNRVVVTGENAGEDPISGEASDTDPLSPTLYGGDFGRVTFSYSSSFITVDDDQAEAVAQTILDQKLGTGQQISFDALVNPALEPYDCIGVRRERIGIGGVDVNELHILDQITYPLTFDGTMTGQTRVARVS